MKFTLFFALLFVGAYSTSAFCEIDSPREPQTQRHPGKPEKKRLHDCDEGGSGDVPCWHNKEGNGCTDGQNTGVCTWHEYGPHSGLNGCSCEGLPFYPDTQTGG